MKNKDELDHIMTNTPRVLQLSTEYENHSHVEEFKKECNVVLICRIYISDGKANTSVSLSEKWNLWQDAEEHLPSNTTVIHKQMINCLRAVMYIESISSSPITFDNIEHLRKIMMHGEKHRSEKEVMVGEYRKALMFAGYNILHPSMF